MPIAYQWSEGVRAPGDAQPVGEWIDGLGEEVTAAEIVEAARPKRSPGHCYFQWDDTVAAEEYRLAQARWLIRHIEIVVDGETTRAFHHVTIRTEEEEFDRSFYMSSVRISKQPALSNQVIQRALRELQGWKKRYKQYQEIFGGVFREIAKVSAK
ncbi:MAG: hypothetical protein V1755_06670 [Chloroflexota bacterium]